MLTEANIARIKAELLIVKNDYKKSQENFKLIMNLPDNVMVEPSRKLQFEGELISLEGLFKNCV